MPTDATPSGGKQTDICYFPGCSLATSAKENNQSLINVFHRMGYNLVELPDWNCCGTSSAHSIHSDLAFDLASRNLSLVPPGKMLLAACPSCLLRLRHAQLHLKKSESARKHYQDMWDRPFDPDLSITHFFEFLVRRDFKPYLNGRQKPLTGIRFAPYYGCMLNRPPDMRHEKNYHGLMEKTLAALGAEPLRHVPPEPGAALQPQRQNPDAAFLGVVVAGDGRKKLLRMVCPASGRSAAHAEIKRAD